MVKAGGSGLPSTSTNVCDAEIGVLDGDQWVEEVAAELLHPEVLVIQSLGLSVSCGRQREGVEGRRDRIEERWSRLNT